MSDHGVTAAKREAVYENSFTTEGRLETDKNSEHTDVHTGQNDVQGMSCVASPSHKPVDELKDMMSVLERTDSLVSEVEGLKHRIKI